MSKDNLDSASSATAQVVVHIDRMNGTALVAFNVSIDLIPEKVTEDLISIDEVLPYNVDVENQERAKNSVDYYRLSNGSS